jgi:hypothetical protein
MPYSLIIGAVLGGVQKEGAEDAADDADKALRRGSMAALEASNAAYENQKALLNPIADEARTKAGDFFTGLENDSYDPGKFENKFSENPAFRFNLDEQEMLRGQKAAAGGKYFSGQTAKEMIRMRQDAGSSEYQNSFKRNMGEWGDKAKKSADDLSTGFKSAQNSYGLDTDRMNLRGGHSARNTNIQLNSIEADDQINNYRNYADQQFTNSITEGGAAWAGNKYGMGNQ